MLIENFVHKEIESQKQQYDRIADGFISSEVLLEHRELKWSRVYEILPKVNQELLGNQMLNKFDIQEYSSVRLIKQLLQVVEKILNIRDHKNLSKAIKGKRYDIASLRGRPHIQAMRGIFELQEMMHFLQKKAEFE